MLCRVLSEKAMARIVGGNLGRIRIQVGLTRAQVATIMNRSPESVARWEQGQRMPTLLMLIQLCSLLRCSPLAVLPSLSQVARARVPVRRRSFPRP